MQRRRHVCWTNEHGFWVDAPEIKARSAFECWACFLTAHGTYFRDELLAPRVVNTAEGRCGGFCDFGFGNCWKPVVGDDDLMMIFSHAVIGPRPLLFPLHRVVVEEVIPFDFEVSGDNYCAFQIQWCRKDHATIVGVGLDVLVFGFRTGWPWDGRTSLTIGS